jgi:ParB/Sulfiredoxin domain
MSERFRDLVGAALGDENALGGGGALERWLAPTLESRIEQVPIEAVDDPQWRPDSTEPDPTFRALKSSVRASGVLQPLLLRPAGDRYQLVSGARRLRAARETGQATVPAVIRELSDVEALLGAWDAVIRAGLSDAERETVAARLAGVGMTGAEVRALLSSVPAREPAEPEPPPRPAPAPYAPPDVAPRTVPAAAAPRVTPAPARAVADTPAAASVSADLPAPAPDGPRPRVISIHLPPDTPGAAAPPAPAAPAVPGASPSAAASAAPAAPASSGSPAAPGAPATPASSGSPAAAASPAAPAAVGPGSPAPPAPGSSPAAAASGPPSPPASRKPAASSASPSPRPAWASYSPGAAAPDDAGAPRPPSTTAPAGWSVRPSVREGSEAVTRPPQPERPAWSPPASSAPPVSFGVPPAAAGAVTSPAVVPPPVLSGAGRTGVAGRLARDPRTYATAGVFLAVWAVVFLIVAVVIGATNKTLLVFAVVVAAIGFVTAIVGLALGPRRAP